VSIVPTRSAATASPPSKPPIPEVSFEVGPLDPAECGLLRAPDLVERFNAVQAVLAKAVALPRFRERQGVVRVLQELSSLAGTMARTRFRIGFIGPSQAGKSTTVSNLLSVAEADSPAPQGTGGPTTSVPTRIVPRPEPAADSGPDQRHAVTLHYFTAAGFRERVRDLCDLLGLGPEDDLLRLRKAVAEQQATKPHFKAADHLVLLRLLDAATKHHGMITPEGRVDPGDYAKRRDYACHPTEPTPNQYALLSEARIDFTTDAVSPELELIDLPGLGVDQESDDRLTLSLVGQLDGAFMFQGANQVKDVAISRLAERMRETFVSSLGERIWMVVTRCDDLARESLDGPPDDPQAPSMFCHLAKAMDQQGIHPDQVIFIGNKYHREFVEAGPETGGPPQRLRHRYDQVLRFTPGGEPLVPERCARHPGQAAAWRRFVLDGGIPGLRETMQTQVADAVRLQTQRDVSARLGGAIDRLKAALEAARQQAGMSTEEMMRAARWCGELDRLAAEIGHDPRYSREVAAAIENRLVDAIKNYGEIRRGRLKEHHASLTRLLVRVGRAEADKQTEEVAGLVQGEIERRCQEIPPPATLGLPGPAEYWTGRSDDKLTQGKTSAGEDFRDRILGGISTDPDLFAAGEEGLAPEVYRAIMLGKAGRVARVYASRLVYEIQDHLRQLQDTYRKVGSDIDLVDGRLQAQYAELSRELDRVPPDRSRHR